MWTKLKMLTFYVIYSFLLITAHTIHIRKFRYVHMCDRSWTRLCIYFWDSTDDERQRERETKRGWGLWKNAQKIKIRNSFTFTWTQIWEPDGKCGHFISHRLSSWFLGIVLLMQTLAGCRMWLRYLPYFCVDGKIHARFI